MKIGIMSDIHLYRKTDRLLCALRAAEGIDILLIVGDLADRAQKDQYDLLYACLKEHLPDVPVYCVSGNHDNPNRDDANYRAFEKKIHPEMVDDDNGGGAFYAQIDMDIDLCGLNPHYHQKQFFFPDKGKQLDFLSKKLEKTSANYHIILCHPPLIAHNPQRTKEMAPYMVKEQNDKLQAIVDGNRHVILISGHTHMAPTAEWDAVCENLYLNDGSICPTVCGGEDKDVQQGNITFLDIDGGRISITITGIYTGKIFYHQDLLLT